MMRYKTEANDNATQVIAEHESIIVKNDIFDVFIDACEKTQKPNKALLDAASFTREQENNDKK
jgi:uncharacterized protein (DUF1778 family)